MKTLEKIRAKIRALWAWIRNAQREAGEDDPTSWFSHWMICGGSTILVAGLASWPLGIFGGTIIGKLVAEFWLVFFGYREGGDMARHKAAGDDMKRYGWDRWGDMVGAVLNDLLWWVLIFGLFA